MISGEHELSFDARTYQSKARPPRDKVYTHVSLCVMIGPTRLIIKSPFQEYSYFTFTVSVLTGQAISTVTSTRECSGGIVAPLWASSVRCGTLVDILRQTNQEVILFKAKVLICIQKNADWCPYSENDKITRNQQQCSFLIGWLVLLLVYADQSVMVIMF